MKDHKDDECEIYELLKEEDKSPEVEGVIPQRMELFVIDADPCQKTIGWTVKETIGIGVCNPKSISTFFVNPPSWQEEIKSIISSKGEETWNKWLIHS